MIPAPPIKPVRWKGAYILLLDQRALPFRERYLQVRNLEQACRAIREMAVRGAPAIGVTAALALALEAKRYRGPDAKFGRAVRLWSRKLLKTRPTAVNLRNALEKVGRAGPRDLERAALDYFRRDLASGWEMCRKGAEFLEAKFGRKGRARRGNAREVRALTLCNTGALATSGFGTALGVLRELFRLGVKVRTYACETRPWLQGSRLTVWELKKYRMPHTLIADGAAALAMREEAIDFVITGADRITRRGDVANKIGTYGLAHLAKAHRIPFYVAAPLSTFDPRLKDGRDIPIEERSPKELVEVQGVPVAPAGTSAWNPVFDMTPAGLVTAYMTERGVCPVRELPGLFRRLSTFALLTK